MTFRNLNLSRETIQKMGKRYKSEKSFKFLEDGFQSKYGGKDKKKAGKRAVPLGRQHDTTLDDSLYSSDVLSAIPSRFIQKIV